MFFSRKFWVCCIRTSGTSGPSFDLKNRCDIRGLICVACSVVCVTCLYAARMLGCESDGNAGVGSGAGVAAVSAYMGGTRGSGDLSSAYDVLEMSVVRGVGGVCDMCMCFARGGVVGVGGEWIGVGLYQFWRNMGKLGYVSVFWLRWCRWCGWCCGEVGGRLGPGSGSVEWCYVCVCCESGFFVLMAGPGICILC